MTHNTFSLTELFSFGWAKTKQHAWFIFLTTLGFALIGGATHFIPVLGTVINLMVTLSVISVSVLIAHNHKPTFESLYTPLLSARRVLTFILLTFLYVLVVILGLILFILPGIYLAVRLKFFPYVLLENPNAKLEDLISMSYSVTKGYFWKIVLFSIMLALLNLCGAILLGIGLLVTIPISLFATAHFYDKMKIVHTPKVAALE